MDKSNSVSSPKMFSSEKQETNIISSSERNSIETRESSNAQQSDFSFIPTHDRLHSSLSVCSKTSFYEIPEKETKVSEFLPYDEEKEKEKAKENDIISNMTENNNALSLSKISFEIPRHRKKKVSFAKGNDFVQIIDIESFKDYNKKCFFRKYDDDLENDGNDCCDDKPCIVF